MTHDEFLALDSNLQEDFLLDSAKNALSLLEKYTRVYELAKHALELSISYRKERWDGKLGVYLNHPEPSKDISAWYSFVDDDEIAMLCIDVISAAYGLISRNAHIRVEAGAMSDPINQSNPQNLMFAIDAAKALERQ